MSGLTVNTKSQSIVEWELSKKYLLGVFRSVGISEDDAFIASLQVLAWVKLSQGEIIPEDLVLHEDNFPLEIWQLNNIFAQLSKLECFGKDKEILKEILTIPEDTRISEAINIALEIKRSKPLTFFDVYIYLFETPSKFRQSIGSVVPIEIVKLMIGIAGDIEGKNIYCPWDNFSDFASTLYMMGAKASIEIEQSSVFPWLVNIFKETNVEILIGNPVEQPELMSDRKLMKFDLSIAFPPFSKKYDVRFCHGDEYNRFPEKTGSGAVLHIRHVLAQTTGKAVIVVPNSVLFSSGVEQSLRQDLLEKNQIEAVISLPPALLPQIQIPFSILVLNNQGRSDDLVSFVNGNEERFFAKDGRGRSRLVNWEDLLDNLRQGDDESSVVRIPAQKILENNSYLEVSAYTSPPERKKIDRLLSDSQTARLNDLVNFVRPPLKQKVIDDSNSEQGIEALEVTIGDFSEYGYAQNPTRVVTLEKDNKNEPNYFLKSGDILIAVKANTGKVAIVSNAADLAEDFPLVVNQSCLIMRCTDKIDPKVLFMYLSSEIGQYLLRSISSGATIPLIQLARLKELQIVIPSQQEAATIIRDFDRLVELQSQIEIVKQQQKTLSSSHWSL
jgi:type I restriction enzyme M protein